MDKKYFFIVCILIFGIVLINYLDNKLDITIENQIVDAFEAGKDIVCGNYILNRNNSYLDNGYFFSEDLIGKNITIKDCNTI